MNSTPPLKHILVVASADLLGTDVARNRLLLERAVTLARASGASIELFHASTDPVLDVSLLTDKSEMRSSQRKAARRCANRLDELVQLVDRRGVNIRVRAQWGSSRVETILDRVRQGGADLVMKESAGHKFLLGILNNPDWELVRRSPVNVWFVKPGNPHLRGMLTAVGSGDPAGDVITDRDYGVFAESQKLASLLDVSNTPVHCFRVPSNAPSFAGYSPLIAEPGLRPGVVDEQKNVEMAQRVAARHGEMIESYARYFGLDTAAVVLRQGHPAEVIPTVAGERDAGLIVMGARSLSRMERITKAVSAEPVLAEANCDVLFVRTREEQDDEEADDPGEALMAQPEFDTDRALLDPEAVFGEPASVVDAAGYSRQFKRRILEAWRLDIEARNRLEEEGGRPARTGHADTLRAIRNAQARLERERRPPQDLTAAWAREAMLR